MACPVRRCIGIEDSGTSTWTFGCSKSTAVGRFHENIILRFRFCCIRRRHFPERIRRNTAGVRQGWNASSLFSNSTPHMRPDLRPYLRLFTRPKQTGQRSGPHSSLCNPLKKFFAGPGDVSSGSQPQGCEIFAETLAFQAMPEPRIFETGIIETGARARRTQTRMFQAGWF